MNKKKLISILATMLCLVVAFAMMLTATSCGNGPPTPTEAPPTIDRDPVESFPEMSQLSEDDTIYILPIGANDRLSIAANNRRLTNAEIIMATSIQGLVARNKAQIYIGSENDVVIPATINDKPVSYINDKAFFCKPIKSITIPSGVRGIGIETFSGCVSLVDVVLPESLKSIDVGAFNGCYSLSRESKERIERINM